jgi:hypothetical protein
MNFIRTLLVTMLMFFTISIVKNPMIYAATTTVTVDGSGNVVNPKIPINFIFGTTNLLPPNLVRTNFFNKFTYYVDGGGGNDTNSGGVNDNWLTIGKANSAAAAGKTVYVRSGIYADAITNTLVNWYLESGATAGLTINGVTGCTNFTVDGQGVVTNFGFFSYGAVCSNVLVRADKIYTDTSIFGAGDGNGNITLIAQSYLLLGWTGGFGGGGGGNFILVTATAPEMCVSNFTVEVDGTFGTTLFDLTAHHMTLYLTSGSPYGILGYFKSKITADTADLMTDYIVGQPDAGNSQIYWKVGFLNMNGHAMSFGNSMTFIGNPAFSGVPTFTAPVSGSYQTGVTP